MKSITLSEKDIARFWSKVKIGGPNECWEWQAPLDEKGYGHFQLSNTDALGRRNPRSHRVSWVISFGHIPEQYCVCHKCDNRKCVNPKHLFLGTYDDNNKDRTQKGRGATGESHAKSKLTNDDVAIIKQLVADGETHRAIAKKFQVSHIAIGNISRGTTWKHLIK